MKDDLARFPTPSEAFGRPPSSKSYSPAYGDLGDVPVPPQQRYGSNGAGGGQYSSSPTDRYAQPHSQKAPSGYKSQKASQPVYQGHSGQQGYQSQPVSHQNQPPAHQNHYQPPQPQPQSHQQYQPPAAQQYQYSDRNSNRRPSGPPAQPNDQYYSAPRGQRQQQQQPPMPQAQSIPPPQQYDYYQQQHQPPVPQQPPVPAQQQYGHSQHQVQPQQVHQYPPHQAAHQAPQPLKPQPQQPPQQYQDWNGYRAQQPLPQPPAAAAAASQQHRNSPPPGSSRSQARKPAPGYGNVQAPVAEPRKDLRSLFDDVDRDRNGYLTEKELSNALVNGDYSKFNLNTVRLMIKMFDRNGNGTLYFAEFGQLWKYLHEWRNIFDRFDTDASECINLQEFSTALAAFGYTLTSGCVEFMFDSGSRIGRNGQKEMSFDMFVQSCINIKSITDTFKRFDTDRDGVVTLGFEEFLMEITKLR